MRFLGCVVEAISEGAVDAGEDGGVFQGVGTGLGFAQLHDEVEERAGLVGLEAEHEFGIVEAERIGGGDFDLRVLVADDEVLVH